MEDARETCLGAAEILSYLEGALPEVRKAEVERHLDECRLCGTAVEGAAGLEWREGYLESIDSVRARIRARTAKRVPAAASARRAAPRLRPAPAYLTLAASLVLGVGAFYWTRPGPGEALFQQYFEPYPSTRPALRGITEGRPDSLALYEARDYRGALALLESRVVSDPKDATALFYVGLSHLALGHDRQAALALEQVLRLGNDDFRAPAAWYLALAHLRRRDLGAARSHLGHIATTEGFYQDKARTLLAELDRLDGGR